MDSDFDEFLHAPARLTIVALLAPAGWTEFGFVRDAIDTSDSALSKQLSALAAEGYVEVRKQAGVAGVGKRRTLTRLTPYGHEAFARHASALERIAATARAMRTADSEED
ncbi:transcriptional regulator [Streptomyces fuscigenes]|uniref:transcriptional regulator n=1 Tax=Streptomyces fuscigenes TaxID=1528880 RepID=UPI001F2D70DE|nr:transcriptional regulator [Streptomyces fuscigenes]MCF3964314.1 transcriptional regulator [Streptomyces fuscigenes]